MFFHPYLPLNVLLTITVKNEGHYINAGIGTWRLQQAFLLASHK